MSLEVEVQVASTVVSVPGTEPLVAWARAAWRRSTGSAGVVVRVVDEEESRRLNRDFRGQDKPTNVLSFPFDAPPGVAVDHVGDLVVCAAIVEREADEQRRSVAAHWAHMVVHGMLHLQGFDHQTDSQANRMESVETEILSGLGFPAPYLDAEQR